VRLAIIIINFRTPQYTLDCLASLVPERADLPGLQVVLIENASGDDSEPRLRAGLAEHGWSDWVTFLPQEKNLGFAGGNNAGFRHVLAQPDAPDFILLLNSDTLVHRGCLKTALARIQAEPDIGVLSCMLRNRDGSVQNVCRRFPSPGRETVRALGLPYVFRGAFEWAELEDGSWNRETTARDVEWVGGAFMLMRTETVRQLGGLDESFFFYGEDIEFCHRMGRHGLRVFFDPAGSITHFGGGSSDPTRLADRRKEILIWKARFHVQRQCYGAWAAAWIRFLYITVFTAKVVFLFLTGRRGSPRFRGALSGWTVLTRPLEIPR
jgi:N-acetylglucosaminyl-diphospho-decaprenol L-rhamnosyltransferase